MNYAADRDRTAYQDPGAMARLLQHRCFGMPKTVLFLVFAQW